VYQNGSLVLSSGNATVTHPATGQWCITVPGVDPTKERLLVSLSSVANYNAQVYSGFLQSPCPSTAFRVLTVQVTDMTGNGTGHPADEPFEFLVP
jgi:hypothetical protein